MSEETERFPFFVPGNANCGKLIIKKGRTTDEEQNGMLLSHA